MWCTVYKYSLTKKKRAKKPFCSFLSAYYSKLHHTNIQQGQKTPSHLFPITAAYNCYSSLPLGPCLACVPCGFGCPALTFSDLEPAENLHSGSHHRKSCHGDCCPLMLECLRQRDKNNQLFCNAVLLSTRIKGIGHLKALHLWDQRSCYWLFFSNPLIWSDFLRVQKT